MHRTAALLLAVTAAAFTAGFFDGDAQAHLPPPARELRAASRTHHPLPARTQLALAEQTIRSANGTLRFLRTHPTAGPYRARQVIAHNHAWLLRYGGSQRREAMRRIADAALPAHYAGWSCITNGAYPGAPHEGNGYNGRYTGPLGMSTPWIGHYPPGSDWVHSSPVAVYAIAEKVAARYGFSYSFMSGQWPATFPPCAGFF